MDNEGVIGKEIHMENVVGKQKHIFIEVLRIVACFFAMVNHSTFLYSYTNINMYAYTVPPRSWYISLIYYFLSKIAVPIFIMISGYTMLDRQDDYKKSAQRIGRVVLVLLVFSSIYYVNQWLNGTRVTIGIFDYLKSLYKSPQAWSHWYLYMYLGLLIMMPFLQKMVANMKKLDCQIFIGISLVSQAILPIIEHHWPDYTSSKLIDLSLFTSYICMMFIGHYMKKYVTPSKKKFVFSVVLHISTIVFGVVMTCYEFYNNSGMNYFFYENRVVFNIILQSASFFYMMMHIKWNKKWEKGIKLVGGCTFGMYLLNDFFIEKLAFIYQDLCAAGLHYTVSEVIWQVAIFMTSFMVTLILKRIPFIKKLI